MMSTARDMGLRYLELDHSETGEARGGLGAVQEHERFARPKPKVKQHSLY